MIIVIQMGNINFNSMLKTKYETFYFLLVRFEKPQRAQSNAEKNNNPLRSPASSAVILF